MKQKPVAFITVMLLMLVTGVFWGTWFTLTRSLEGFSAGEFIYIGKMNRAGLTVPPFTFDIRIVMTNGN